MKHRDYGDRNDNTPCAYIGWNGSLYRCGYHVDGIQRVHRVEYGLEPTPHAVRLGEWFVAHWNYTS